VVTYEEWIARERRLRLLLLQRSPVIKESGILHICQDCGEVCLCHEETCPDCNSTNIGEAPLFDLTAEAENRFRCRYRYSRLNKVQVRPQDA